MKKVLCILMALSMSVTLFACTNKKALAVEEQINALGEITLDSEAAVAAAEEALSALRGRDRAAVTNIAVLDAARVRVDELKLIAEADKLEEMIHDLRPITMGSGDALKETEKLYNEAPIEIQLKVENFDDLVSAFQIYRFMRIDQVEVKINAIGEVTADSGAAIAAAQKAYDEIPEEDRSWVYNALSLQEATEAYEAIQKGA